MNKVPAPPENLAARVFRNAGVLFSSKGVAAITGLFYLALAGRHLGAAELGMLVLIHSYVLFFRDIASFKSWQVLIKYGAEYLGKSQRLPFSRLLKLTAILDIGGAVLGTSLALVLLPYALPQFGIPSSYLGWTSLYCLSSMVAIRSTPIGLLRLFNRFSILARISLVVPLVRMVGVIIAVRFDQPLVVFILIWFVADILSSLAYIWQGLADLARHKDIIRLDWFIGLKTQSHDRIWKFIWNAHLHTTLKLMNSHLLVILSGFLLGPASVAYVKVAQELSGILTKPAILLSDVIFPELSRLTAVYDKAGIRKLLAQTLSPLAVILLVVSAALYYWTELLLDLTVGPDFLVAADLLKLFMFSGVLGLAFFWLEPFLYAMGKPEIAFYNRFVSTVLQVVLMILLTKRFGLEGIGIASLAAMFFVCLTNFIFSMLLYHRMVGEETY